MGLDAEPPAEGPVAEVAEAADRTQPVTAPYGHWESAIDKEALFRDSRTISTPRVCSWTGRAFFLETRPDGISQIVETGLDGTCADVLPEGYSARSSVYEYGGSAYAVLPAPRPRLLFSQAEAEGASVHVLDVDAPAGVRCLVRSDTLRYGDYDAHPTLRWVLALEEDHGGAASPKDVRHRVVALHAGTGAVCRLAAGADFYMSPRFSPDGALVCWLEWDFPHMPWSGARLFCADWTPANDDHAALRNVRAVAGAPSPNITVPYWGPEAPSTSVTEPRWGPDGFLYFCYEEGAFRQLCRTRPGVKVEEGDGIERLRLPGYEDCEFGRATMSCDSRSYAVLSATCVVAVATRYGTDTIVAFNPQTLQVRDLGLPLTAVVDDGVARLTDTSFLVVGGGAQIPTALYRYAMPATDATSSPTLQIIRQSVDQPLDPAVFPVPQHITFEAFERPRVVHGFFWYPHNARYRAPPGTLPPLVVSVHGGPTGHTAPGLDLELAYFNSRGFATLAVNYAGSTGHGRKHRQLLNGRWGSLDGKDVAASVEYLVNRGLVDGTRVGVRGGSAGGFTVLQSLGKHASLFAGGVCYYGIGDLATLRAATHKMEARYVDILVFQDSDNDDKRAAAMRNRSPLNYAVAITAPLLLCHGDADHVVPIGQARAMFDELDQLRRDVRLVELSGEGHGFRQGANRRRAFDEEEAWWARTLCRYEG